MQNKNIETIIDFYDNRQADLISIGGMYKKYFWTATRFKFKNEWSKWEVYFPEQKLTNQILN